MRRPSCDRPWLAALLAAAALCGLAACSDGYPSQDVEALSPFDMSNTQRVAALNELGRSAQPAHRWRYELQPGCALKVHRKTPDARGGGQQIVVLKRAMDSVVVFDETGRTFDVRLRASAQPDAADLGTVLRSKTWTDAMQADLFMQLLIRDCAGSGKKAAAV